MCLKLYLGNWASEGSASVPQVLDLHCTQSESVKSHYLFICGIGLDNPDDITRGPFGVVVSHLAKLDPGSLQRLSQAEQDH